MSEEFKIKIPESKLGEFEALVHDYALRHSVPVADARKLLARRVLQSGIREFRKTLDVARDTSQSLVDKYTGPKTGDQ